MPTIEVDLRELQKHPGWMMGIGAGATVLLLALVLLFSSLFAPRAVAEAPTSTPTTTPLPTATPVPTFVPTPLPTPTPEPEIRVWMPDSAGAYLSEAPGGPILVLVPNGAQITLLGDVQQYGGTQWQFASYQGHNGWLVEKAVYRLTASPVLVVTSEDGAFLRTAPYGSVITWLSQGSPILQVLEEVEGDTYIWEHVVVPDGRDGWVARFLLGNE